MSENFQINVRHGLSINQLPLSASILDVDSRISSARSQTCWTWLVLNASGCCAVRVWIWITPR
jgi:hypothetical protein